MHQQQHHYRPLRYHQNHQWGISLIPVMISIAIFTAIAVQYMLPQQQQQQNQKNLDAAQIAAAQLLQASLDYRADDAQAQWPDVPGDLAAYLPIINNNPWGNPWQFFNLADNQGLILITQTGDSRAAIELAARFGGIARVCSDGNNLCDASENNGTWVYIGISPP